MASHPLLDPAGLTPEAALVLSCASTAASPARTAAARDLALRVGRWDRVVDLSKRHAVFPLVYRYLTLECRSAVPADAWPTLRTPWQMIVLYNRHLTSELIRLTGLLDAAGIPVITFKGPALAAMAYGSIEMRQFTDLDILVRQTDLPKVAEILTAERYRSPHTRREGLATSYFQEYEDAFTGPEGLGAVDVHWQVMPRSFRFAPAEEAMWRDARAVDLGAGRVNAVAPEDLLLYICVHGAKHGWVTLGWICDVAETLRARPAMPLMALLDQATALGSRRMFLTGIYLAHALLDAPLPDEMLAIAAGDRAIRAVAARVAARLFSANRQGRADFDPWIIPLRSIEGPRARLRYLVRRTLAPTMGDYELLPLPRPLFPLYWLIRPFRLALQYTPHLLQGPPT